MTGDDLQRLRAQLGMTQEEFAAGLGMSRKSVNEMERGRTPIERRTELAARQLFNEHAPLYGWRDTHPLVGDVPLADAQLIWDRKRKRVKVIGADVPDDQSYNSSFGACNSDWVAADTVGRLLRLFSRFHELTVEHGIPPETVHQALLVIPEYRRSVSLGTLPDEYREEHHE